MSPECDRKIPISMSWKKVRSNDPEYYMEAGTRTAMQRSPFMVVPMNAPKNNAFNSVLIGAVKDGNWTFKATKSIRFVPNPTNPRIVQSIPIDLAHVKKGKGVLIANASVIDDRPAQRVSDYTLFKVKEININEKFVCLDKIQSDKIQIISK